MDIIPVYIEEDKVTSVLDGTDTPANGIAFKDRRSTVRDNLSCNEGYLFERFGRAVYKHMRHQQIQIAYTPMLPHDEALAISDELRPILQALWRVYTSEGE